MKKELEVSVVGMWVDKKDMHIHTTLQFRLGSYQTLSRQVDITELFKEKKK